MKKSDVCDTPAKSHKYPLTWGVGQMKINPTDISNVVLPATNSTLNSHHPSGTTGGFE